MKPVAYIRFSDKRQERGASRDRQIELCRGFCAGQGWPEPRLIEDLGKSAWAGDHLNFGNLGKFAAAVRAGAVEPDTVIVVEKLDRLSRQEPLVTLSWLNEICSYGLRVAAADDGEIYDAKRLKDDFMALVTLLLRSHLAHSESQQKSVRVRDRIKRNRKKVRDGEPKILTRKAPGWLVPHAVPEQRPFFDLHPTKAPIVVQIYQWAAEGKGPRLIAKLLNENGVRAWGQQKGDFPPTWEATFIRLILTNPAVEGDYVPGFSNRKAGLPPTDEEPIIGYFPRAVDATLVAEARRVMEGRKTGPRTGGAHTRNVANLFAGLIRCGECGGPMHVRTNGERPAKRHLQCNRASRKRGCSQSQMFRYDAFEDAALDAILHLALDDKYFEIADETAPLVVRLATLDKSIRDAKDETERLVGVLSRMESLAIEAKLTSLERHQRTLEDERDEVASALTLARGAVSPAEHFRRVREVRAAFSDPDTTVRTAARARVQMALRELGVSVTCEVGSEDRLLILLLSDASFRAVFKNDGSLLALGDDIQQLVNTYPEATSEELAVLADNVRRNRVEALFASGGVTAFTSQGSPDRQASLTSHARRAKAQKGKVGG